MKREVLGRDIVHARAAVSKEDAYRPVRAFVQNIAELLAFRVSVGAVLGELTCNAELFEDIHVGCEAAW